MISLTLCKTCKDAFDYPRSGQGGFIQICDACSIEAATEYLINQKEEIMSQAGPIDSNSVVFGSQSKTRYEPYTDEELASEEFFWNQMKVIIEMKNIEYFYHFLNARLDYIERMSGM